MATNSILSTLFLFIFPLLGLFLGAILPPFHYAKHPWLASGSNALGFILFMVPFALMTFVLNHVGQQCGVADDWNPVLMTVLFGAATVFAGIEALVFFLLWLRRRLKAE